MRIIALMLIIIFVTHSPSIAGEQLSRKQWASRFQTQVINVLDVPSRPKLLEPTSIMIKLNVYPNGKLGDIKVATKPSSPHIESWFKERIGKIKNVLPIAKDRAISISIPIKINPPRN